MSSRLHRKSRPQADVELYAGGLRQKSFKGGMNIDRPASEIGEDQVANAENVRLFERHIESRPGSRSVYYGGVITGTSGTYHNFIHNANSQSGTPNNVKQYILHRGNYLGYVDSEGSTFNNAYEGHYINSPSLDLTEDVSSCIRAHNNGAVVFTKNKIVYLDGLLWFKINAANPIHGIAVAAGSSGAYQYRYLATMSRIMDSSHAVVANRDTAGAILLHESGSNNNNYADGSGTHVQPENVDYGVVDKTTAIGSGTGNLITNATLKGVFSSTGTPTDNSAALHFTHVSIYRTRNIDEADPLQLSNPKDVYVWVADVKRNDIFASAATYTDEVPDTVLADRLESGAYQLRTRGFQPMPSGQVGEVTPGYMFVADNESASPKSTVYYSDLSSPQHMGYYFPGSQFKKLGDTVNAMRVTGDILSIFCTNSTHTCTLTAWTDGGAEEGKALQAVRLLTQWTPVDRTLGVKDWGTIAQVDKKRLIAVCSDATVRMWDSDQWGEDISYDCVNSEIAKIIPANPNNVTTGSLGVFFNGGYWLFYSKTTADTRLTNCLRYGFGGRGGFGWTFETSFINLPFRCGATAGINNVTGMNQLVAIPAATANSFTGHALYWLETFTSYYGSGLSRLHKDAQDSDPAYLAEGLATGGANIACKVKFREMIAQEESETLVHQETHVYFRPYLESVGYISGFEITLKGYKDGATSATETIENPSKTGDIHFEDEIAGRRIQLEITTNAAQFKLVGIDSHCRSLDRVNYATAGENNHTENTTYAPHYQEVLAYNLAHHISRREDFDLPNGVTATGTQPLSDYSRTTGPEGHATSARYISSMIQFASTINVPSNAGYSILFGVKSPAINEDFFVADGTGVGVGINVRFATATTMRIIQGTAPPLVFTVSNVSDGAWHLFALLAESSSSSVLKMQVRQNGAAAAPASGGTIQGNYMIFASTEDEITAAVMEFANTAGYWHELRFIQNVISVDAADYWRDNIVNGSGNQVLPMM